MPNGSRSSAGQDIRDVPVSNTSGRISQSSTHRALFNEMTRVREYLNPWTQLSMPSWRRILLENVKVRYISQPMQSTASERRTRELKEIVIRTHLETYTSPIITMLSEGPGVYNFYDDTPMDDVISASSISFPPIVNQSRPISVNGRSFSNFASFRQPAPIRSHKGPCICSSFSWVHHRPRQSRPTFPSQTRRRVHHLRLWSRRNQRPRPGRPKLGLHSGEVAHEFAYTSYSGGL